MADIFTQILIGTIVGFATQGIGSMFGGKTSQRQPAMIRQAEPAQATPAVPTRTEPDTAKQIADAQDEQRRRQQLARGQAANILTSGQGIREPLGSLTDDENQPRTATLLGG